MAEREQDHQHPYVGTNSPDADGDTGDRTLTDEPEQRVAHREVDEEERRAALEQMAGSEDQQGSGGMAGAEAASRQDLAERGRGGRP